MTAKIFECQMQMYKFSFEKQTEKGKILFLAPRNVKKYYKQKTFLQNNFVYKINLFTFAA